MIGSAGTSVATDTCGHLSMRGVSVFPTAWLSKRMGHAGFPMGKRVMSTLSVVGPVVDVEERALGIDHESCTAQLPVQPPQEQR